MRQERHCKLCHGWSRRAVCLPPLGTCQLPGRASALTGSGMKSQPPSSARQAPGASPRQWHHCTHSSCSLVVAQRIQSLGIAGVAAGLGASPGPGTEAGATLAACLRHGCRLPRLSSAAASGGPERNVVAAAQPAWTALSPGWCCGTVTELVRAPSGARATPVAVRTRKTARFFVQRLRLESAMLNNRRILQSHGLCMRRLPAGAPPQLHPFRDSPEPPGQSNAHTRRHANREARLRRAPAIACHVGYTGRQSTAESNGRPPARRLAAEPRTGALSDDGMQHQAAPSLGCIAETDCTVGSQDAVVAAPPHQFMRGSAAPISSVQVTALPPPPAPPWQPAATAASVTTACTPPGPQDAALPAPRPATCCPAGAPSSVADPPAAELSAPHAWACPLPRRRLPPAPRRGLPRAQHSPAAAPAARSPAAPAMEPPALPAAHGSRRRPPPLTPLLGHARRQQQRCLLH